LSAPSLSFLGLGTFGIAGLSISVCMSLTIFVLFSLSTIMTMPPGLVPLQDVLVAESTPAPFDSTDKVTSAQMSNVVVRHESFFL
jgi:hypothetical protein